MTDIVGFAVPWTAHRVPNDEGRRGDQQRPARRVWLTGAPVEEGAAG